MWLEKRNGPSKCVTLCPLQLPGALGVPRAGKMQSWELSEPSLQCQQHIRVILGRAGLGPSLQPPPVPLAGPKGSRDTAPGGAFIAKCFIAAAQVRRRQQRMLTGQISSLGRGCPAAPLLLSSQGSPCCSCASLSCPLIICCYLKRQQNKPSTASFLHLSLLALFFFFAFFSPLVLSLF